MDPTPKRNLVKEQQILINLNGSHPEENYGWEIRGREQATRVDQTTTTTVTVLGPDGFAAGKNEKNLPKDVWELWELKRQYPVVLHHA